MAKEHPNVYVYPQRTHASGRWRIDDEGNANRRRVSGHRFRNPDVSMRRVHRQYRQSRMLQYGVSEIFFDTRVISNASYTDIRIVLFRIILLLHTQTTPYVRDFVYCLDILSKIQ
jgi:hypothetical protein